MVQRQRQSIEVVREYPWCVTFIGVERFDWQQAEPQRDRCVDAIERMGQYSMPDNARKPAHDIA